MLLKHTPQSSPSQNHSPHPQPDIHPHTHTRQPPHPYTHTSPTVQPITVAVAQQMRSKPRYEMRNKYLWKKVTICIYIDMFTILRATLKFV